MIQRIQSVYLFAGMVIGIGFLTFSYPVSTIPLKIGWISTIILLLIAIISYKNRRMQIILSILAGITFLISQIYRAFNLQIEGRQIWIGITLLIFYVFLLLAIKNIQKDEKLVKDTNRLR